MLTLPKLQNLVSIQLKIESTIFLGLGDKSVAIHKIYWITRSSFTRYWPPDTQGPNLLWSPPRYWPQSTSITNLPTETNATKPDLEKQGVRNCLGIRDLFHSKAVPGVGWSALIINKSKEFPLIKREQFSKQAIFWCVASTKTLRSAKNSDVAAPVVTQRPVPPQEPPTRDNRRCTLKQNWSMP